MCQKIILIRHASIEPEYSGRYIGSTDPPLGEIGIKQAKALAEHIKFKESFCSPLKRAQQTARLMGIDKIETDADLREIDFGKWEGKTFDEIKIFDPQLVSCWAEYETNFAFPGGESIEHFLQRVHRAGDRLANNPADTVLVVTHGGVIRSLICYFLGLPSRNYLLFDVKPASITTIELFNGKGVLAGLENL